MADYILDEKDSFTVIGLGTELKSHYTDFAVCIRKSQALPQTSDFAYVGGPNTSVEMGQREGLVFGEMWIPVIRK